MSVAGFVLVGGRSSRMGRDKARLPVGSRLLVEDVANKIRSAAGNVALVGAAHRYTDLNFECLEDLRPSHGPLGGIETALASRRGDLNLIVGCDMPDFETDLLRHLLAEAMKRRVGCLVCSDAAGAIQPLCGVWSAACLDAVSRALDDERLRLLDIIKELNADVLPVGREMTNINTPEQWTAWQSCLVEENSSREPAAKEEFPHYIEFRNVCKTFDRPVLKDISFYADAGKTLAIIGRSGVGKSVSLGHIMGFLKPDSGQVIVAGTDITNMSEEELRQIRRKVTMVFQSGALFDSLTVGENIEFSLETCTSVSEKKKEDVVDDLLKKVDLVDLKDQYPGDLATGYKRAVAIARALAAQPECILYDEPTTMVDPIMSDRISNLMLRLKNDLKITAVVVTHDLDLMRKVADSVMFLYKGEAIYFGPVADLETCPDPHVKQFLAMDRVEIAGKIDDT